MVVATESYEFNTVNWALDNSLTEQLTDPGEFYTVVCPSMSSTISKAVARRYEMG